MLWLAINWLARYPCSYLYHSFMSVVMAIFDPQNTSCRYIFQLLNVEFQFSAI